MICRKCGTENPDDNFLCTKCRRILQPALPDSAREWTEGDLSLRAIVPVGRSGLAIAAGYAGLFALLILPAPLAILLGVLAIRDIRRHPGKLGMGRAIFGLVMGILALLLFLLFWFIPMLFPE